MIQHNDQCEEKELNTRVQVVEEFASFLTLVQNEKDKRLYKKG